MRSHVDVTVSVGLHPNRLRVSWPLSRGAQRGGQTHSLGSSSDLGLNPSAPEL